MFRNAIAAVAVLTTCLLNARAADQPPTGQLPRNVVPTHYALSLTIVPERDHFSGSAEIDVEIREPVSVIWLHGDGLDVRGAELALADGTTIAAEYQQVNATGLAKLALSREVKPQEGTLRLEWTAPFSSELDGLYRVTEDGEAYAFTQFEPIAARKAFPGFDEPGFKTPYDITLTVKRGQAAITATPEQSREPAGEGLERVVFQQTPPLPTYLVAFAVGPLDVVDADPIPPNSVRHRPLPFRGVAVKGKGERLHYALQHTGTLLAALERYTGIPFPFPKLDIIAVPDFEAGAMENVGAITFREYLIMLDEGASMAQKRAFAGVVTHELSHYWFGDLVTMPWWDDIWLNEAFATWFAAKGVKAVHPEYRPEARLFGRILNVMDSDSLVSARRIRQPIESSNDIYNAFDGITYVKGAAVLGMFERYVGAEVFQRAAHDYLTAHANGNADYRDFLAALSSAAARDVAPAFESFLNQSGLPQISVADACANGGDRLKLSQSRYLPLGSSGDARREWRVPVCLRYGDDGQSQERCLLMDNREATVDLEFCPDWVMPNAGGAGYYRWTVTGDAEPLARTEPADSESRLREQMAYADSVGAAVRAGTMSVADALERLTPFAVGGDPLLAELALDEFRFDIDHLTADAAEREAARRQLGRPLLPALLMVNLLPNSSPETLELRRMLLSFATLDARMEVLLKQSAKQAVRWVAGEAGAVDPDLLETVLTAGVLDGGEGFYGTLAKRLDGSLSAAERRAVIAALGHATGEKQVASLHELVFSKVVRSNEIRTLLEAQAAMPETRRANWEWVKANFDRLADAMPAGHAGRLPGLASGLCGDKAADEVQAFFEPRIEALRGGPRNLAQALEKIHVCAAVAAKQRESFARWLARQDSHAERVNRLSRWPWAAARAAFALVGQ